MIMSATVRRRPLSAGRIKLIYILTGYLTADHPTPLYTPPKLPDFEMLYAPVTCASSLTHTPINSQTIYLEAAFFSPSLTPYSAPPSDPFPWLPIRGPSCLSPPTTSVTLKSVPLLRCGLECTRHASAERLTTALPAGSPSGKPPSPPQTLATPPPPIHPECMAHTPSGQAPLECLPPFPSAPPSYRSETHNSSNPVGVLCYLDHNIGSTSGHTLLYAIISAGHGR